MIEAGELLEWATVHNAYRYGTPRPPVEEALAAGDSVLLEIDLQGARSVRRAMPEAHARLPAAADLGRTGAPARRSRHRETRPSSSADSRPRRSNWRPRTSSITRS